MVQERRINIFCFVLRKLGVSRSHIGHTKMLVTPMNLEVILDPYQFWHARIVPPDFCHDVGETRAQKSPRFSFPFSSSHIPISNTFLAAHDKPKQRTCMDPYVPAADGGLLPALIQYLPKLTQRHRYLFPWLALLSITENLKLN
jgi:hypothetical protein